MIILYRDYPLGQEPESETLLVCGRCGAATVVPSNEEESEWGWFGMRSEVGIRLSYCGSCADDLADQAAAAEAARQFDEGSLDTFE